MSKLSLRPYHRGDSPAVGSVPVTVIVLTQDEEPNIGRCLGSVAWARQVVVVDSGSTDGTVKIAQDLGAEVVEQTWLGFSGQREFALRLPQVQHDWIYFVDADEWAPPQLACEIASRLAEPGPSAFAQRFRLVFQGRWIRHCGWYGGSWIVRLMDRRCAAYHGRTVAERAAVHGAVGRLDNDLVDEDLKGLAAWLHKHVGYAELDARNRHQSSSLRERVQAFRSRDGMDTTPLARAALKYIVFPSIPLKPLTLFTYMYVLRLGLLDGNAGLKFCFYHAWYESVVGNLQTEAARQDRYVRTRDPMSYARR